MAKHTRYLLLYIQETFSEIFDCLLPIWYAAGAKLRAAAISIFIFNVCLSPDIFKPT